LRAVGQPALPFGDVFRWHHDHDALDGRRRLQDLDRPAEDGPPGQQEALLLLPHAEAPAGRRHHRPGAQRRPPSSSATRVKIIRPAAVWSTEVTATATVWPRNFRPWSMTTMVPSSR